MAEDKQLPYGLSTLHPVLYSPDMTSCRQPPKTMNAEGEPRRIGVEIEFGGISIGKAAALVQEIFGGEVCEPSPHIREVRNTDIGDFEVELDAQLVHPKPGDDEFGLKARKLAGDLSSGFVPTEIVGPPAPLSSLADFDRLVQALREAGAEGTADGFSYAFGLQLNPEVPSDDAADILKVLQAYILMSPLLRRRIDVDTMRRLLPYVDPFPLSYARRVLHPGYAPDMAALIDDYILDNPTRNRELDMLPLFMHLDEERVRSRLDDPLIKSRPTYHYRLPNTNFTDPNWNVTVEWNRWVIVERLAADEGRRTQLAETFMTRNPEDFLDRLSVRTREWLEELIE